MSSSTLQRLMMSAQQQPESMLDRLHGGQLPPSKANELVSHHAISHGRPHRSTDFSPEVRTETRFSQPQGSIPSEILVNTAKERGQDMREEQQILTQMIRDNNTIQENF